MAGAKVARKLCPRLGLSPKQTEMVAWLIQEHLTMSMVAQTRDLNDWLQYVTQKHPPPAPDGKRIKPRYMAQMKTRPPTFVLFGTRLDMLPESYRRYLINGIRRELGRSPAPAPAEPTPFEQCRRWIEDTEYRAPALWAAIRREPGQTLHAQGYGTLVGGLVGLCIALIDSLF